MKISDKELDDLFNSKLNDFEVEPSEMVWDNIATEIKNNKAKKKSIVPFLRIAASIIIVVSVGLMLLKKDDPIVKKPVQNKLTKVKTEQQKPLADQKESTKPAETTLLLSTKNKDVKTARQLKIDNKKSEIITVQKTTSEGKTEKQMLAANSPAEKKIDENTTPLITTKTVVVPDISTRFNVKTDDDETVIEPVKAPVLAAKNSMLPVAVKRKGIRSMGDLVNLVMAKVDKRQDKLIEFTSGDDGDESNVTGINLGIISIKKEK